MKTNFTTTTGIQITRNQMRAILIGIASTLMANRRENRYFEAEIARYGITKELAEEADLLAWYNKAKELCK